PEFVRDQLAPKLVTEAQLIFVLRLVVPILQRFYDAKERSKQIQDLAVDVYKMTVKVNERVGVLKYEDSICDFLYHMKYMYVGDFVKNEAEQAIQRLSPSMRDKLKYISHTQINATNLNAVKRNVWMEHDAAGHPVQFSQTMKRIRGSSWYWGNMSWRDAEKVLMNQLPGTYLVRDSASDRYIFTISYRTKHSVHHTRLAQHGGNFCLGVDSKKWLGSYAFLFVVCIRRAVAYQVQLYCTEFLRISEIFERNLWKLKDHCGPNSLVKANSLVSFIENSLQSCGKRRICMLMHPKSDSTGIEILELNHLLHRHELLPSLKYLCRVVIRNCVEKELLACLPLPPNMIYYLKDPKYFVPSCVHQEF
ncbi:unnamed protein product, partial [Onchocerca ochengi]|uniref:Mediator of RNA polymerase II transcription subunit 23 n=1 Tax=Onchocerca ochengi TaxID=42157 RepID=A0A182ER73_ONCOC